MSVLANHGITLRGIAFDTMLGSYVLNAGGGSPRYGQAWPNVTSGTRRSTSRTSPAKARSSSP